MILPDRFRQSVTSATDAPKAAADRNEEDDDD
jgi:hypothetical protein